MQEFPHEGLTPRAGMSITLMQSIALLLKREAKAPLRTQMLSPQRCVFSQQKGLGAIDIIVLPAPADLDAFEGELRKLISAPKPNPIDIVVVGGGPEVAECMERAKPRLVPKATGLIHIAEDLSLWSPKSLLAKQLLDPVRMKLAKHAFDAAAWAALEDETHGERAQVRTEGQELQVFVTRIRKRRPIATYAIALAIGLVFAMQLKVGIGAPPTLLRMGALSAARVAEGEWWRLLTCTFLHGGTMHVLMNVYVLFILGSFVERILGPARLVLLYCVSAIAGSVGSVLFLGDTFSVGASGAIWGMLGAHAVLAFRHKTLLPAAMIPGARKAAVINLALNVGVSFMPHVDMWAHFFGGAAGALLLLSGVITRGLTKETVTASDANAPDPGVPTATWLKGLAIASALVMLASLGICWSTTHPWALGDAPEFAPRTLTALGVELDLPLALERANPRRSDAQLGVSPDELVFGDVLEDAMVVGVYTMTTDPMDAAQREVELSGLENELTPPEHSEIDVAPRRFTDGADEGVEVRYSYPSGMVYERAFLLRPGRLIRVEAYRWPDLAAAPAGSATRIAKSARVL